MAVSSAADQLSLAAVYDDEHLIQMECRMAVGGWSGITRAYTNQNDLRTFAEAAEQFGKTLGSSIAWEAGADAGIGLIGLRLYTIDRSGHIRCHVRLASDDTRHRPPELWHFAVELPTEAGLVITFALHLARVAEELRGQAVLPGVHP